MGTIETPVKTPDSSFKTRMKSALIFGPVVLFLIVLGGGGFKVMMALAAAVGVDEWGRMVLSNAEKVPPHLVRIAAICAGVSALFMAFFLTPLTALWLLLAFGFLIFAYNLSLDGPPLKNLIGGLVYIGLSISVMMWVRGNNAQGLYHFLTLLFIVWGSDVFAYLTGRTFGGPKLAPAISPKKTWSGFIGSSLGAGAIAAFLALPVVTEFFHVTTVGNMGPIGYFIMAGFLAMFGQAGDLLISVFKRRYGVKDTGTLIPGHGGLLDRIDALLLVALVFGMVVGIAG